MTVARYTASDLEKAAPDVKYSSDYDLERFLLSRQPGRLMWEQFRYSPNLGQDAYDKETERLLQEIRDNEHLNRREAA